MPTIDLKAFGILERKILEIGPVLSRTVDALSVATRPIVEQISSLITSTSSSLISVTSILAGTLPVRFLSALIASTTGSDVDPWTIPPDDEVIYEFLSAVDRMMEVQIEGAHKVCAGMTANPKPCPTCKDLTGDEYFLWHMNMIINKES